MLRAALLPACPPVEERDRPADEGNAPDYPERVHHGSSPVSRTATPTSPNQPTTPPAVTQIDNGCCPTNCPSTKAPAQRFASSRKVSTRTARRRFLNRSIVTGVTWKRDTCHRGTSMNC